MEACTLGCNPHCHFILLLQSLSFDHSVLLDFLISSETCFLEYLVLYLRLLRDCWQDFCSACTRMQTSTAPPAALVDYEISEEEEDREQLEISSGSPLLRTIMKSLEDLQMVVLRLTSRGIFPYNPTSLLRLLSAAQALLHQHGPGPGLNSNPGPGLNQD